MDHGFALITEERKANGLFLKGDITFNTTIANMNHYKNGAVLSHDRMVRATAEEIKIMHTKCMGPDDMITSLSGGNQQKVVLARWLATHPKILILNGPTVGVDIGAKYDIHKLLRELAKQGMAVLVVSDDVAEITALCDRALIMKAGSMTGEFTGEDLTDDNLYKSTI